MVKQTPGCDLTTKQKSMKPELILQADLLDIIFEDRNKEYGAYNLRKGYNNRMIKAITGALFISIAFSIMSFITFPSVKSEGPIFLDSGIVLKDVNIKPPPLPEPPSIPKKTPATLQYTKPVIVNHDVVETIPKISQIAENILIGAETIEGPPAEGIGPVNEQSGKGSEAVVEVKEEQPQILRHAQSMPEFPGGHAAFINFLSRHLRVPDDAVEPGQKVKILVQFVVGKAGEISDIQFLQTNGEVFEQEVTRVMKKMPRWRPGMQNGEKVAVYYKLPVVFEAHGE